MGFKLLKLRRNIIHKMNALDRAQNTSISVDVTELNKALDSSTLLTKWFRGWKARASSSMSTAALESLTQTVNAYTSLLDAQDQMLMQQHRGSLRGARQELYEQELLTEGERYGTEKEELKTRREVSRLARLEAELDRKKTETELEKLRKKHGG